MSNHPNKKVHNQTYYSKNRERILARQKLYQSRNVEKIKEYNKNYREKNIDKIRERIRLDRITNPEKYRRHKRNPQRRYEQGINNARNRNIKFEIEYSDYLQLIVLPCYYCGQDFSTETGFGLDRIHNSRGYYKSNVVTCCGRCNSGRSNLFSSEEWKVMMEAYMKFKRQP